MLNNFSSSVMKETQVDFGKRTFVTPVELEQYDDSEDGTLVCIKVDMYKDDQKYYAPPNVTIKIKHGMYGGYFAYYDALGFLGDRSTVIIPVRLQMTLVYGDYYPSIELITQDGSTMASAAFHVHIRKSPVQMGAWSNAIKSTELFPDIKHYAELQAEIEAAIDHMTETDSQLRIDMERVMENVLRDSKVLILHEENVTSLPFTISNSAITSNMVAVEVVFTNESALTSNWTADTSDGTVTINGSMAPETSTDIIVYMLGARTTGDIPIPSAALDVDVTDKADKVNNATTGNIPALDLTGNLTDSGLAKGDIAALINLIMPFEEATATRAHEKDTYLIYNNKLYRVKSDIAIGDTLHPGTTIQQVTTLGDELKNIDSGGGSSIDQPTRGHAREDLDAITVGWNLGNTFDATITLDAGDPQALTRFNTDAEVPYYETCWGCDTTTEPMFDLLKESGFNAVRIPITWAQHVKLNGTDAQGNPQYIFSDKWLERIHEVVDWCMDKDLYCIINTHHDCSTYNERIGRDIFLCTGWLNCNPDDVDTVDKRFRAVWARIADEFKNYGDKLIFEGFNELQTSERNWHLPTLEEYRALNILNQTFIDVVRDSGGNNETRTLSCQTYGAMFQRVSNELIESPVDPIENGIIWQIHDYTILFDQYLDLSDYNYFIEHDMPLIVGEFGTLAGTATSLTEELRIMHAQNFVARCKAIGVKCLWWDDENSGNLSGYTLMDRANVQWTSIGAPIVEALMRGVAGTPINIDYTLNQEMNDWDTYYEYKAINSNGAVYKDNDRSGAVTKNFIDITGLSYFGVSLPVHIGYTVNCVALYDDNNALVKYQKGGTSTAVLIPVGAATKAKFYVNNPWGYRSETNLKDDIANGDLSIVIRGF